MNITIYGLVDPRKPEIIRYVGQTAFPMQRHLQHCRTNRVSSSKQVWIASMIKDGVLPQMIRLASVDATRANQEERDWQSKYFELTNDRSNGCGRNPQSHKTIGPLEEARVTTEKAWVSDALETCDWNMSATAQLLGISRPTLYDKVAKLGIIKPSE